MKRLLIVSILIMLTLTACDLSLAEDITPPPDMERAVFTPEPEGEDMPSTEGVSEDFAFDIEPDVEFGLMIFAENCASCHGVDGLNETMVFNGTDIEVAPIGDPDYRAQYTPQEWYTLITNGNMAAMMPPFSDLLTPEERWGVSAFTFGLNVESETLASGADVYAQRCASCHGDAGMGDGPKAGNFTPPPADFTDQVSMSEISNEALIRVISSGSGDMPSFAGRNSEEEIDNVAAYIRSLAFPVLGEDAVVEVDPGVGDESAHDEPMDDVSVDSEMEIDAEGMFTSDISGSVIDDSNSSPAGLTVTLLGVGPSGENINIESVVTDDNSFLFEDIEMGHGWQFLATVTRDGAHFSADEALTIVEAKDQYEFIVRLTNTTNDLDDLVYENLHIFVDYLTPEVISVVQSFVVTNNGTDMVVPVSDEEPAIRYGLPPDAANLGFMDQNAASFIRGVAGGIGDLNYVPVGENSYSLIFYYELMASEEMAFDIPLQFELNEAFLFLPPEGLVLDSEQFVEEGIESRGADDQRMMYSVSGLSGGDVINIRISEDQGPLGLGGLSFNYEILIGGLGFLAVVAVVFFWFRRSQQAPVEIGSDNMQEVILDKIVALDERFNQGEISEADYQKQRNALKTELAEYLEE